MGEQTWAAAVRAMQGSHGIMHRQALGELVPRRTVQRRIEQGLLVPVNRRVVALPGTRLDLLTTTRAATLALPAAIPTGPSAMLLLGLGWWEHADLGALPWLVHARSTVVTARYLGHPGLRTVTSRGLRVAHPVDALVDVLRCWPRAEGARTAEQAMQRGLLTLGDLVAAHARMRHFAGRPRLAEVIGLLADGSRSEAERRLASLLREAGIVGWAANVPVTVRGRPYVLDLAFDGVRLALEVDGRAFHSDARAFQRDRTRQNDLVAAGWTVLRFTWQDIVERPEMVVERVRALLAQLGAPAT